MAHYQLSYGFNSIDNSTVSVNNTSTDSSNSKIIEIKNIENQLESENELKNDFSEKTEAEKRKLSQPSESSNNNRFPFMINKKSTLYNCVIFE